MTVLFEMLFHACCPSFDPERVPEHMRGDPVMAYGQYAFEEGFKLAVGLLFLSLDHRYLSEIE